MILSPAIAAEPVKMPFGVWTPVSPRKQELDGGSDLPMGAIFEGKSIPL